MFKLALKSGFMLLICVFLANIQAHALVIDDFDLPDPCDVILINHLHPNPQLYQKTTGGIMGGERDAFFEVKNGAPDAASLGVILGKTSGQGMFYMATGPGPEGSAGILQYDGIDLDDTITPALINSKGLNIDITEGGVNDRFAFRFLDIDGVDPMGLDLNITVTGTSGGTATKLVYFPDAVGVISDHEVLFNDFTVVGANPFSEVSSLTFAFNSDYTPAVDFGLDYIQATNVIPEPSTVMLFGSALLGCAGFVRRKRLFQK